MKTFDQFVVEAANSTLDSAKNIIKILRTAGYQAYLVGGCVRDTLLHLVPKDYDVATDATPDHVVKLFPESDKVGAHFGVVISNGIEIATFRSDGSYGDGRRPDSVHYEKDPKEDASRRDFTVNAMFLDPFSGHILDFFGGQEDIKKRVLRAVGDPFRRFQEDHLRMMRAVRFASKLGFTIDPDTMAAMSGQAPNIKGIAVERTTTELTKSLAHDPGRTFDTMYRTGLLDHVLPEVAELDFHRFNMTRTLMEKLGPTTAEMAVATLFSQVDPKVVATTAKRLKLTNDETAHVLGILSLQPRIGEVTPHTPMDVLKKILRDRVFPDAIKLYGMEHGGKAPYDLFVNLHHSLTHEDLHPERFITGDDLIKLGMKPGKAFKDILDVIENGQLNGSMKTREQAVAVAKEKGGLK